MNSSNNPMRCRGEMIPRDGTVETLEVFRMGIWSAATRRRFSRWPACRPARARSAPEFMQADTGSRSTATSRLRKAAMTSAPPTDFQSQRDCVFQPRVARDELPWVRRAKHPQPQPGLRPSPLFSSHSAATPSGLYSLFHFPQGSSFLATLGFMSESLWDSPSFWG